MILIIDTNFKKELELLSPNYPFDPSEFMFKKFYNSTDGSTYYPFFMRYVITEEDFLKAYSNVDWYTLFKNDANPVQKVFISKLEKDKQFIKATILANLARYKWYKQGYFKVLNRLDPVMQSISFVMN